MPFIESSESWSKFEQFNLNLKDHSKNNYHYRVSKPSEKECTGQYVVWNPKTNQIEDDHTQTVQKCAEGVFEHINKAKSEGKRRCSFYVRQGANFKVCERLKTFEQTPNLHPELPPNFLNHTGFLQRLIEFVHTQGLTWRENPYYLFSQDPHHHRISPEIVKWVFTW